MLFMQPQKNRRFQYTPRFAKPEEEERFSFKRKTLYQPRAAKSPVFYLILAAAFFLLYLYLNGGAILSRMERPTLSPEDAVITDPALPSQPSDSIGE
ncbi:MAG: hypothetical protein HQ591_01225 [candidate division Zixibacteria bacterium]|nr:hypothetical protein [Candidatus Tariuqbacter arcticus]